MCRAFNIKLTLNTTDINCDTHISCFSLFTLQLIYLRIEHINITNGEVICVCWSWN